MAAITFETPERSLYRYCDPQNSVMGRQERHSQMNFSVDEESINVCKIYRFEYIYKIHYRIPYGLSIGRAVYGSSFVAAYSRYVAYCTVPVRYDGLLSIITVLMETCVRST